MIDKRRTQKIAGAGDKKGKQKGGISSVGRSRGPSITANVRKLEEDGDCQKPIRKVAG